MRKSFSGFVKVFCFSLLMVHSSILFGIDCKDIFSFAQAQSFKNGLSAVDLSKIPSSYRRFIRSVADPSNEYGYLQADYKAYKVEEGSESDRVLYPVVEVDLYSKDSESILKLYALVISPKEMLLVTNPDEGIDINSFEINYKNHSLTVTKEFSFDGLNVYQLSSASELSVELSDMLSMLHTQKTIRNIFSLRYVPQNEKDLLPFIFPEAKSMVKLFLRKNIIPKDILSDEDLFSHELQFQIHLGFIGEEIDNPDENLLNVNVLMKGYREYLADEYMEEYDDVVQELAIRRLMLGVSEFISYASRYYNQTYKAQLEGRDIRAFKWVLKVMPLITKILSSDALINSYTDTVTTPKFNKELLTNLMSIVSRWFSPGIAFCEYTSEDLVTGLDEEIAKLADIYLVLQSKLDFSIPISLLSSSDNVSGVDFKSALRSAFKRVIWSMGRMLYLKDKKLFDKDNDAQYNPFAGYATVVSSNTIITSEGSLFTMSNENMSHFSDLVSVQKGNRFIDAIDIHEIPVPGTNSSILVIRFPDGTFDDLPHTQVGKAEGNEYGILVSESNFNNNDRALSLVKIEKNGSTGYDQSRVLRNVDLITHTELKPYTLEMEVGTDPKDDAINFKRRGYPIFENHKLVGILDGAHTSPNVIKLSEELLSKIKDLTYSDPKLKIGGIN